MSSHEAPDTNDLLDVYAEDTISIYFYKISTGVICLLRKLRSQQDPRNIAGKSESQSESESAFEASSVFSALRAAARETEQNDRADVVSGIEFPCTLPVVSLVEQHCLTATTNHIAWSSHSKNQRCACSNVCVSHDANSVTERHNIYENYTSRNH